MERSDWKTIHEESETIRNRKFGDEKPSNGVYNDYVVANDDIPEKEHVVEFVTMQEEK